MKRILFFLLLLVNLQLTTDNGSLSIGFGEVSAQRLMESSLANTITRSSLNTVSCWFCHNTIPEDYYDKHLARECEFHSVECDWCHNYVIAAQIDSHQSNDCPYRTVYCYNCFEPYIYCQGHLCKCCAYCGRTLGYGEYCDCPDCEINGQEPWWMKKGYPAGGSNGGYDNGGEIGSISIGDPNKKEDRAKIPHKSYKELKKLSGIKWLGNKRTTTASENLKHMVNMHPQNYGTHDCVPRAFAFLEELWYGVDFETALQKNKAKARAAGINTDVRGFSKSHIEKLAKQEVFYNDPTIICYPNDIETIRECIDNGIPVAVSAQCYPPHMVVVIGYDLDNSEGNKFYVAGGNLDRDVSIIGVMFRNGNFENVYGIKH